MLFDYNVMCAHFNYQAITFLGWNNLFPLTINVILNFCLFDLWKHTHTKKIKTELTCWEIKEKMRRKYPMCITHIAKSMRMHLNCVTFPIIWFPIYFLYTFFWPPKGLNEIWGQIISISIFFQNNWDEQIFC